METKLEVLMQEAGVGCGVEHGLFVYFLQCDIPIYSNNSNSNLMPSLVLLLPSLCSYIMSMVLKSDVAGWIPSVLVHSTSV